MSEQDTNAEVEEVTTTTPPPPADDDIASRYRPVSTDSADTDGDDDDSADSSEMVKEWVKFGVLVVVLLGAVFVVWASRPLIFGGIVPAVMNANPPAAVAPQEPAAPATDASTEEAQQTQEAQEAQENEATGETSNPNASTEGAGEAETEAEQPPLVIQEESSVTVEDATAPATDADVRTIPYTVQAGDSLYTIAQRYGVTIEAITAVNPTTITNPNTILPGTEIQIPVP